jgi:hypothetical protein
MIVMGVALATVVSFLAQRSPLCNSVRLARSGARKYSETGDLNLDTDGLRDTAQYSDGRPGGWPVRRRELAWCRCRCDPPHRLGVQTRHARRTRWYLRLKGTTP